MAVLMVEHDRGSVDAASPIGTCTTRERPMKITTRSIAGAGVCAALMFFGSVAPALAGEVKGPPGTVNNTNETGALDHANSICAASGLNDLDTAEGQTVNQVQTAADSWKIYGFPKGFVGTACRGGSGERVAPGR